MFLFPRRLGLLLTFVFALCAGHAALAKDHHQHNLMGSHGMVLVNAGNQLVASHLPLYRTPHHYQLIYLVEFQDENTQRQALNLLADGQVTILPNVFDLTTLIKGESMVKNTKLFSGHFERGGKEITSGDLAFKNPVFIRDLRNLNTINQMEVASVPLNNTYSLAVHHIDTAPSFDAIGIINTQNPYSTVNCEKVSYLQNHNVIQKALTHCIKADWRYIETQDFQ